MEDEGVKILIACEFSGTVRDAFRARGHDAISCDLIESETPGPHIVGDAAEIVRHEWDMVIAHPPCQYLANSGVHWLHRRPERWEKMRSAAGFFRSMLEANAPRVAVENPTMHSYAREIVGRGPDFSLQPWEHGHGETKRTCFWLRGLPPLLATRIVQGRAQRILSIGPSPERWKKRSRTLPGVAQAMAEQWG